MSRDTCNRGGESSASETASSWLGAERTNSPVLGSYSGTSTAPVQLKGYADVNTAPLSGPARDATMVEAFGHYAEDSANDVQAVAAQGVAGGGATLPHAEQIQAAFGGHDIGGVRSHVGGAAADAAGAIGALAYATGNSVAFAQAPDLHTAAHEAAHVVQQRGGVQLKSGVGQSGDQYERHADAVADLVVQGRSAETLLDSFNPAKATTATGGGSVQKWEAKEHKKMGDNASRGARVQLAPDCWITFGQMVALAGDHFKNIEQMRDFAKKASGPRSRAEIAYAIHWKGLGPMPTASGTVGISEGPQGAAHLTKYTKDAAAESAHEKRYYSLAMGNTSHFLNPVAGDGNATTACDGKTDGGKPFVPTSAGSGYGLGHSQAISEAVEAAQAGGSIDNAMATEAFAAHYLTDAFAGGHIRTERKSISEHWDPRVPMFNYNMKGYIAEQLAHQLEDFGSADLSFHGVGDWKKGALAQITETFDSKGPVAFGDIVSGVVHDYDNHLGVSATVDFEGQTQVVQLTGDGTLGGDQQALIERVAARSIQDVRTAFNLGSNGMDVLDVFGQILTDGAFVAERALPKQIPPAMLAGIGPETGTSKPRWDYETVGELLRDSQFAVGAAIFGNEKASELTAAVSSKEARVQTAMKKTVIADFKSNPIGVVRKIINWTPNTSGGVFGHNQDDNANDYWKQAKATKGGLKSLTRTQRVSLVGDLLDDATVGDDETAIMDVLESAPDADARGIISLYGWTRLYDDVDDWAGEDFADRFPKKNYGK